MKRGHLIKEEISFYFRIALVFRDGRCGAGHRPRWDGRGRRGRRLERGKKLLPEKHGNDWTTPPKAFRPIPWRSSAKYLSGDMALRIEKAFGVKMDTLMRMQSSYDIAQTCKREKQISMPRISLLAATH
jgi:hypothetical protein